MSSYINKNKEVLIKAEILAKEFSIDLPSFYKKNFIIKEEFTTRVEKIPYEELCNVDNIGGHNGFIMIFQSIRDSINYLNTVEHDINAWTEDFGGIKGLYDDIDYAFNHIYKWMPSEKKSNDD
jgi:hypothetical protein